MNTVYFIDSRIGSKKKDIHYPKLVLQRKIIKLKQKNMKTGIELIAEERQRQIENEYRT